jgi:hypothetical protein
MFLSYQRSLSRSLKRSVSRSWSPQFHFDLRTKCVKYSRGNFSRENFSRENFSRGFFHRGNGSRGFFPVEIVICAFRILEQVLKIMVPGAAQLLHVVRRRWQPAWDGRNPAESRGHFLLRLGMRMGRAPTWISAAGSWRVALRAIGSEGQLADQEAIMGC